jgi:hypothetical protein
MTVMIKQSRFSCGSSNVRSSRFPVPAAKSGHDDRPTNRISKGGWTAFRAIYRFTANDWTPQLHRHIERYVSESAFQKFSIQLTS